MNEKIRTGGASFGIGVVLVGLGVLFMLQQVFDYQFGQWLWPFFIIVPGLLCFVGMVFGGKSAGPLAIPGSIVTTIGLILFYQNTFDRFESWAYAWALIPVAVGLGVMINGMWSDQPALIQNGRRVAGIGLVLFLVGFVFFELILNIGGVASSFVAPLLMIIAGIYLLLRRARPAVRPVAGAPSAMAEPAQAAQFVTSPIIAAPSSAGAEPADQPSAVLSNGHLDERELGGRQ